MQDLDLLFYRGKTILIVYNDNICFCYAKFISVMTMYIFQFQCFFVTYHTQHGHIVLYNKLITTISLRGVMKLIQIVSHLFILHHSFSFYFFLVHVTNMKFLRNIFVQLFACFTQISLLLMFFKIIYRRKKKKKEISNIIHRERCNSLGFVTTQIRAIVTNFTR